VKRGVKEEYGRRHANPKELKERMSSGKSKSDTCINIAYRSPEELALYTAEAAMHLSRERIRHSLYNCKIRGEKDQTNYAIQESTSPMRSECLMLRHGPDDFAYCVGVIMERVS